MTKIKLADGTIINASSVELVNGTLKISTSDFTVEELAEMFADKEKTASIVLMTESGVPSGYKVGFTSFAGINYDPEGVKTIELFQPASEIETRLAKVEAMATDADVKTSELEAQNEAMASTIDNILSDLATSKAGAAEAK